MIAHARPARADQVIEIAVDLPVAEEVQDCSKATRGTATIMDGYTATDREEESRGASPERLRSGGIGRIGIVVHAPPIGVVSGGITLPPPAGLAKPGDRGSPINYDAASQFYAEAHDALTVSSHIFIDGYQKHQENGSVQLAYKSCTVRITLKFPTGSLNTDPMKPIHDVCKQTPQYCLAVASRLNIDLPIFDWSKLNGKDPNEILKDRVELLTQAEDAVALSEHFYIFPNP